ncbi:MAG: nucleotidyltransferase [Sphingobacteriales bacterium]|nr:nucleotidyltransferase [Sphingobacteriales bacterium]OJW01073.1 MAG: nucleotidyltransferase [Sphingobacteriales bacterium 44-61]
MATTEQQLISWSKPVSTTEDEKCKRAISQITEAIRNKFGGNVSIFLQGSYENNTNVRKDSDVDIVVRHDGYFYDDLQRLNDNDKKIYEANRRPGDYQFDQLKDDVHKALISAFGSDAKRKNKCIEVLGNSYRITGDVVPCFVHKRFATLTTTEVEGIQFYSDTGTKIISFPKQHYQNGVIKTESTGRMYKRIVRILKVIKNSLIDSGKITEDLASSFFIECLVYNVPNDQFVFGNYTQILKNVITKVYNDMGDLEVANKYVEVSGYKWLFGSDAKRPPANGKEFMLKCWQYAEF